MWIQCAIHPFSVTHRTDLKCDEQQKFIRHIYTEKSLFFGERMTKAFKNLYEKNSATRTNNIVLMFEKGLTTENKRRQRERQ